MKTWSEVAFKDILEDGIISYGIVQPGSHTCVNSVPVLRVNNISQNGIDTSNILMVSKSIEGNYARTRLKGGELLITVVGNVGLCVNVPEKLKGWNVARAIAVANINNIFDSNFIKYQFYSDNIKFQIYGHLNDTVQPTLNLSSLKEIKFYVPPLPEQRAIASVLSSLDTKIDLLHRQNATLEAMAEALFKQWFVVGAKEEWEICHLGDILDTVESGSRPKGGIDPNLQIGIASIGAENIDGIGKYDFSKTKFVTQEFYDQMKRGKIRDYDVLVYKDGAYIGKKGMFALGYPFTECAINEHVFILRANKKARQSFLYFLLQKDEIEALNSNAAQPGINQDALKSLEIFLPSKNEIDKFDTIVLPWINKIFVNALQIRTLEKLRDSLLPKLMSGEVRVKY